MSPFRVSRPCCEQITSCPSACSAGISFWKQEPSAHSPCAKTMPGFLGLGFFGVLMALSPVYRGPAEDSAGEWWRPLAGGLVSGLVHHINNTLEWSGNSRHFRANQSLLCKTGNFTQSCGPLSGAVTLIAAGGRSIAAAPVG